MREWQQRVITEYDELSQKLFKLVEFVFGEEVQELPTEDQTLLRAQLGAMSSYSSLLEARMQRFTKEEPDAEGEEGEGGPDD